MSASFVRPEGILLPDFGGDPTKWLEAVHAAYHATILADTPLVCGVPVVESRGKDSDGKSATFWHVVSEGKTEAERLPVLARGEAVPLIRPLLDAAGADGCLWWIADRKPPRVMVATEEADYLVVLAPGKQALFLVTAFPVERQERRDDLKKERERWFAKNGARGLRAAILQLQK